MSATALARALRRAPGRLRGRVGEVASSAELRVRRELKAVHVP